MWEKKAYQLNWLPESSVVQAYPEVLVSYDGTVLYTPPVYDHSYYPALSVQGYPAWQGIENCLERVMVRQGAGAWLKTTDGIVDNLLWDPIRGDTLLIGMQDGSFYRAQAPGFEVELIGDLGGRKRQSIWSNMVAHSLFARSAQEARKYSGKK